MKEGRGFEGNLDKDARDHFERDAFETGSKEKIDPGQDSLIHNTDEAWEGAHAEKPFRDAARNKEYLEKAPGGADSTKEFLDWVATEEGEKALEAFRAQSGAEKNRAREILLDKAIQGISVQRIAWSVKHRNADWGSMVEKEREQVLLGAVDVSRIVAKPEIEKILDGKETDKPSRVAHVAGFFSEVLEQGIINDPNRDFPKMYSLFGENELGKYVKEADFAWRLARGYSVVGGLRGLARARLGTRGNDADTAGKVEKETENLIRNYLGLITDVREGKVASSASEEFKKERAKNLDADLEQVGFVFNEESRKYIEVE